MPGGRPTDYRPEYCETVVELGKLGKSKAQIAVALNCVRSTLDLWAQVHAEFSDAMARAREESLAWWEEQGTQGVWGGKQFNAKAWEKSMAARFPGDYHLTNKTEITNPDGSLRAMTEDQIAAKLEQIQRDAAARMARKNNQGQTANEPEPAADTFTDLA